MYYLVCGLPDLTVDELTTLLKSAQTVLTSIGHYQANDLVTRRDVLMLEKPLPLYLAELAGKTGPASASGIDQQAACRLIGAIWSLSTKSPARFYIATMFARAALEVETQKIAAKRQPLPIQPPATDTGGDRVRSVIVMIAGSAAAVAVSAAVAYFVAAARRELRPVDRRRRR